MQTPPSPLPLGAARRLAVLACALVLAAPPVLAGSSTYEDARHGFEIKLPSRDWSQTPTQPGETTEVAKFKDDRQSDFSTISIYRFEVKDAAVATPGEGEQPPTRMRIPGGRQAPETGKDYLAYLLRWKHRQFRIEFDKLPEADEVKVGDRMGTLYTLEVENPEWKGRRHSVVAGIVDDGQVEYLIVFVNPHDKLKKIKKKYVKSFRSFRFPEGEHTVSTEELQEDIEDRNRTRKVDGELLDPEKRAKVKQGLRGDWRFLDTPHYIVLYNCDDRLAKHIAKRIEYMREFAFEVVFPPVEPIEECMVVRVCREKNEYAHYGGPPGSAGYWSSGHDELVFPDLSRSSKPDEQTLGVLNHEGFHQYIHYALLKNNLPIWFNEGFAEYFFCVEGSRAKLKFMKHHPMRFGTVKSALGTGKLFHVKDFIKLDQPKYYRQAGLCYAQGWAFCTWLKNHTKNKRYRQIPEIMFREMQKGYLERAQGRGQDGGRGYRMGMYGEYNPVVQAAMEKAFEGIDLEEMDEDFKKGLKKM